MAPVVSPSSAPAKVRPCVLVVDDEPGLVELVADVAEPLDCRILTAANVAQARQILADRNDVAGARHRRPPSRRRRRLAALPAAAPAPLGQRRGHHRPAQRREAPSAALRQGAVDFIPKPFSNEMLLTRLRKAIEGQARAAKDGRKIERLRVAVRRLNEARRTISKKVDLLCNDLVSAYGELSRQLDDVRTQEGFRKYVAGAKDLEQLLCHAMDWLLRQVGYSNVAVWLAGEDGDYQLGAYMKYTVAGEPVLTDALRRVVLPLAPTDGVARLRGRGAGRPPHAAGVEVPQRPRDPRPQLHLPGRIAGGPGLLPLGADPVQRRRRVAAEVDRPDLRRRAGRRRARHVPDEPGDSEDGPEPDAGGSPTPSTAATADGKDGRPNRPATGQRRQVPPPPATPPTGGNAASRRRSEDALGDGGRQSGDSGTASRQLRRKCEAKVRGRPTRYFDGAAAAGNCRNRVKVGGKSHATRQRPQRPSLHAVRSSHFPASPHAFSCKLRRAPRRIISVIPS